MNIAIFTDTYYPDANGIAVSTKNLVDVLKEHGHQVIVITSTSDNKRAREDKGVYYIYLRNKRVNMFSSITSYRYSIFKLVRNFKPDIIHNQTNNQIGQIGRFTANKLNVPFVYTYHIHYEEYMPYTGANFFRSMARTFERNYFRHMANISTEFIAPSVKIRNYLRKKGVDKHINVVPTGIDAKKFEIDETMKKEWKYLHKKFNIQNDEKVILYVGSLSREKNIDYLLNAFKTYLKAPFAKKCKLLIVGEGDQYSTLDTIIKDLDLDGYVELVGKINHEKIKSYYYVADAYVSASTTETQCLTIMEAMLSGCLVLSKIDETIIDIIEEERTGFTYIDEEQFASKLNTIFNLSEEEKKVIKERAFKKIEATYSLEKFYDNIMEVYDRAQRKNW